VEWSVRWPYGILVITTYDTDEEVYRAVRAGVNGYLLKDANVTVIAEAMRSICKGGDVLSASVLAKVERRSHLAELSPREMDVLRCLAEGLSNKEAAAKLRVGDQTVKGYLKTLFQKLHVLDRTQAVVQAMKIGLLR
jgi:two-component system, NarL family, response regulator